MKQITAVKPHNKRINWLLTLLLSIALLNLFGLSLLGLTGCGQKGPLTYPDPTPHLKNAPSGQPSDNNHPSDESLNSVDDDGNDDNTSDERDKSN